MLHEEGWEGKKGYFWEINPEHLEKVNKELFRYLNAERFSLDEMRAILLRKWSTFDIRLCVQQTFYTWFL